MLLEWQTSKSDFGKGWTLDGRLRVSSDEASTHEALTRKALNRVAGPVVGLYAALMLDLDVAWDAPLPEGPKIIAPNHPTTTDPFLVTTVVREPVSILIDDRLFKVPLFGRYLRLAGHVPVVPGRGREAFEAARRLLEAGRTVAIFPEGHISPPEGGFYGPRTGAVRLSLITGAPIVPVGIHLDRARIRLVETSIEGKTVVGTWYLRGPYAITVGEPMRLQGDVEDREHVRAASERLIQRIAVLARQGERRTRASQVLGTRSRGSAIFGYRQNVVRLMPNPDEPERNKTETCPRRFLLNVQDVKG